MFLLGRTLFVISTKNKRFLVFSLPFSMFKSIFILIFSMFWFFFWWSYRPYLHFFLDVGRGVIFIYLFKFIFLFLLHCLFLKSQRKLGFVSAFSDFGGIFYPSCLHLGFLTLGSGPSWFDCDAKKKKKIGKENAIEINARIANTVAVFIEVVDILIRSLGSVTAFGSSSVMVVTVPWRYSFHLNSLMLVAMSFSYAIFPSDPLGGFAILPSYFHHHPLSVPSYFLMLGFVSYSKRPVSLF